LALIRYKLGRRGVIGKGAHSVPGKENGKAVYIPSGKSNQPPKVLASGRGGGGGGGEGWGRGAEVEGEAGEGKRRGVGDGGEEGDERNGGVASFCRAHIAFSGV